MPVSPVTLIPTLNAAMISQGLAGTFTSQLATGVAQAIVQFLPTIVVTTVHLGVLGAGQGIGKVVLEPTSGAAFILGALTSAGMSGTMLPSLAVALAQGIALEINALAIINVVVTGSSNGGGSGFLVGALEAALIPLLLSNLTGQGLLGSSTSQLSLGLGTGIASWMRTGIITTVDVGTPVPPFTSVAGVGLGTII